MSTPPPDPDLQFLWLEVKDLQQSIDFYRQFLGFPVVDQGPNLAAVHLSHIRIYLAPGAPRGMGMYLGIVVADIDAMHARLQAHGLNLSAPTDEGWARYISLNDPDGYRLQLLQLTQ